MSSIFEEFEQQRQELAALPEPYKMDDAFDERERQINITEQLAYAERLYAELGKIARLPMNDNVVKRILGNFPEWEYDSVELRTQMGRVLVRHIEDPTIKVGSNDENNQRRQIVQSQNGVLIKVPEVIGEDLRLVLEIEKKIIEKKIKNEHEIPVDPELTMEFSSTRNMNINKGGIFSNQEVMVLELYSTGLKYESIAKKLCTSGSTISRLLHETRARLEVNTVLDLIILGIANNDIKLDDVPENLTWKLTKGEKSFLANTFNADSDVMDRERGLPAGTIGSYWSRIKSKIGVNTKPEVIMAAVKDGIIELPDLDDFPR